MQPFARNVTNHVWENKPRRSGSVRMNSRYASADSGLSMNHKPSPNPSSWPPGLRAKVKGVVGSRVKKTTKIAAFGDRFIQQKAERVPGLSALKRHWVK